MAIRLETVTATALGTAAERIQRSQPAESQECGIENSDQPQSRQTITSGEGFIGGWLNVRWLLR
jgi:hypothetical protein